jgi:hypothetical protein
MKIVYIVQEVCPYCHNKTTIIKIEFKKQEFFKCLGCHKKVSFGKWFGDVVMMCDGWRYGLKQKGDL